MTSHPGGSTTYLERYEYTPYGQRQVYVKTADEPPDPLDKRCRTAMFDSSYGCEVGHQGRLFDIEWEWYDVRRRPYAPILARFPTRDPLGYVDGVSLYEYVRSGPIGRFDWEGEKVYWAARDLDHWAGMGNHHFILAIPDNPKDFKNLNDLGGCYKGFTLAADKLSGRLQFQRDMKADLASVREVLGKKTRWWKPDYDMVRHEIKAPKGMTDTAFIKLLETQTSYYVENEKNKNVKYKLTGPNCATWVNTMFKVAGIDEKTREKQGEFDGIDWGEEDTLPEWYFEKRTDDKPDNTRNGRKTGQ